MFPEYRTVSDGTESSYEIVSFIGVLSNRQNLERDFTMFNLRISALVVMAFVFFSLPKHAGAFYLEMNTYMPTLDLRLRETASGRSLNLKEYFGMQDISTTETKLYLNDRFKISYRDFNYSGSAGIWDSTLPKLKINSDLGLQYAGVSWYLPLAKSDRWESNWMIDLKGYSIDGQMGAFYSDHELLTTDRLKLSGLAPSIGLAGAGAISDQLGVYGEISALPMGDFGSFWEMDAGFKYRVQDRTLLHIGYRIFDLVTNNSVLQTSLHTRMNGPYFGLNYDF